MKVLILGINGFIGNALAERLLADERTEYEVYGMDLETDKLGNCLDHERFQFVEGDITIHREWVEYHIKKSDVVFPLVAIATPADYIRRPLTVFELAFEENLRIVRLCIKYGKRVVFPSTSETYGMSPDSEFKEDESFLVTGPIRKQRWIYSTSKQLLDRVIWAYGQAGELEFTIFRPFNWVGPKLDSLDSARIGSSRVITQFVLNLVEEKPIQLVDGGRQTRCFTYLSDGIDALVRIIENDGGRASGQIFNVGNPASECSIAELADRLSSIFTRLTGRPAAASERVDAKTYYGKGYQDIVRRVPSVAKAKELLGWEPKVALDEALEKTTRYFLEEEGILQP